MIEHKIDRRNFLKKVLIGGGLSTLLFKTSYSNDTVRSKETSKKLNESDEIKKGDVVYFRNQIPHVVSAIGEVPEHPTEYVFSRLYESGTPDSSIPITQFSIKGNLDSQITKSN